MQDMHQRSFGKNLKLQQLLHVKRLEKPDAEFWSKFDRELQQKQLQALVRPPFWKRARAALSGPRLNVLAPISAVAVVCLVTGWALFSFHGGPLADQTALRGDSPRAEELAASDSADAATESEPAEATIRPDARFVVDALVPETENPSAESFRTVAVPETFVAGSDTSAKYVTNAFTTDFSRRIGSEDMAVQF